MNAVQPRRAFLRGLATLPLVGGAVQLIGNPSAVAMPVSNQLMHEYIDWLGWERNAAIKAFLGPDVPDIVVRRQEHTHSLVSHAFQWHHEQPPEMATTRAALVLSAVGCDWRGPYL